LVYKGGIWLIKKKDLKDAQDRLISKVTELEYKLETSEKTINVLNTAISNQQQLITKLIANKNEDKAVPIRVTSKPKEKSEKNNKHPKKRNLQIINRTLNGKGISFVRTVFYKTEVRIYGNLLKAFENKRVSFNEENGTTTFFEDKNGHKVNEMSGSSSKLYIAKSWFSEEIPEGYHKAQRNADGSLTIFNNVLYDKNGKEIRT